MKSIQWVSSAKKDLTAFPEDVRQVMGYALYLAQTGSKHPDAKVLKGFSGSGVLEVVDDFDGDTYRSVYTVQFENAVYVLHAFKKKSKSGSKTPARDVDLVNERLKRARKHYEETQADATRNEHEKRRK